MIDKMILVQAHTFCASVLFGWCIGILFDLWRFLWKMIWNRLWIKEMIFWIFAGIAMFLFTIHENEGTIRSYLFLGWMTGWLLYRSVFRQQWKRIYISCRDLLKKVKKNVKMSIERRLEHGTKEKE